MLDTKQYGFVLPFEVVSMLLLAAMIGCIVIAMKAAPKGITVQKPVFPIQNDLSGSADDANEPDRSIKESLEEKTT